MLPLDAVYNQDCIAGMKSLGKGTVDLAFADPPFNIGYDYDVYRTSSTAKSTSTGAGNGPPRWSACSSRTAPSGWPSATNTPPS